MPTKDARSLGSGRRRAFAGGAGALALLLLASLAGLAGCASTSGSAPGSGATTSASSSPSSDGNWQTVTDISGSSTSSGGGTNEDTSESSTTVNGAYRVLAACQGSGSLAITLKPGGALTVHCTSAQQEPVRVAGSDSAPTNGTLDITVARQGDIEWSQVKVQIRV